MKRIRLCAGKSVCGSEKNRELFLARGEMCAKIIKKERIFEIINLVPEMWNMNGEVVSDRKRGVAIK